MCTITSIIYNAPVKLKNRLFISVPDEGYSRNTWCALN